MEVQPLAAGMDAAGRKVLDALGGIKIPIFDVVRAVKWAYIELALRRNNYNYVHTARALGLHRNTLSRNLEELGMVDHVKRLMDEHRGRGVDRG